MGEVYLAFDDDLKRKIALKFLRAELTGDRRRLRRFQQEARAASALNHPNILTVFEIGQMTVLPVNVSAAVSTIAFASTA